MSKWYMQIWLWERCSLWKKRKMHWSELLTVVSVSWGLFKGPILSHWLQSLPSLLPIQCRLFRRLPVSPRRVSKAMQQKQTLLKWSTLRYVIFPLLSVSQGFFRHFFSLCRKSLLCVENCMKDSQCGPSEKCVNGKCIEGCNKDKHCGAGYKCIQGECIRACKTEEHCDIEQFCHIDFEICLDQCQADQDCSGGYKCINGECLAPCSQFNTCPQDQYCHKFVFTRETDRVENRIGGAAPIF